MSLICRTESIISITSNCSYKLIIIIRHKISVFTMWPRHYQLPKVINYHRLPFTVKYFVIQYLCRTVTNGIVYWLMLVIPSIFYFCKIKNVDTIFISCQSIRAVQYSFQYLMWYHKLYCPLDKFDTDTTPKSIHFVCSDLKDLHFCLDISQRNSIKAKTSLFLQNTYIEEHQLSAASVSAHKLRFYFIFFIY